MAAYHLGDDAAASGCPKALLLRGEAVSPEDEKFGGLLDCLGVSWQAVRASKLADGGERPESARGGRFCVMVSASCLGALSSQNAKADDLPSWMTVAESIYVYGFSEEPASQALLRLLTGDLGAKVRSMTVQAAPVSVSRDFPEMCGGMSGMQFEVRIPAKQAVFDLPPR